jgi:CRISPR-associated protein Csm5
MKHPSIKNNLGRTININTLFDACNRFYWGRMVAEGNRFDERASDGASWKSIEKTFPLGQLEDGRVLSINPSVSFWNDPEYLNRRMLLRVGHFSHFESLSVDELRRGWNARKKEPITDMGSTRTRCVMEKGKDAMPFGWLMLTLDQEKDVKTY